MTKGTLLSIFAVCSVTAAAAYMAACFLLVRSGEGLLAEGCLLAAVFGTLSVLLLRRKRKGMALCCILPAFLGVLAVLAGIVSIL